MSKPLRNLFILLAAIIAGTFIWRYLSRRFALPCPTWLAGFLEMRGSTVDWLFRTEETLDHIGLQPGQRVLEIGPGPGRLLIPAAQRVLPGGSVVGLDLQPGMLKRLAARAEEAGVRNLTAIQGDAIRVNVLPATFDVVYIVTVLGEITDREAALRQCYSALKPGGRLSITEIFPDPHYQSRQTVQRMAEEVGFKFQALYGMSPFYTINFEKPENG